MGRYDRDDRIDDDEDHDDLRSIRRAESPHSGVGILSIVLGIVTFFAFLALIVGAGVMEMNGRMGDDDPEALVLGVMLFACLGGWLIGLVLGIVGAFQSERNRVCAVVGLVVNGLLLVGVTGLFVVALIMHL